MNFPPQIVLLLLLGILSKKGHVEGSSLTLTDCSCGSSCPTSKEIGLLVGICQLAHIRSDRIILQKDTVHVDLYDLFSRLCLKHQQTYISSLPKIFRSKNHTTSSCPIRKLFLCHCVHIASYEREAFGFSLLKSMVEKSYIKMCDDTPSTPRLRVALVCSSTCRCS